MTYSQARSSNFGDPVLRRPKVQALWNFGDPVLRRPKVQAPWKLVLRAAALVLAASSILACGAADYTYVKNSGERTYFKVPRQWHRVDQAALDDIFSSDHPDSAAAAIRQQMVWSIAYDADGRPSPLHLFAGDGDDPFVYATVRHLTDRQRDAISFDTLRNAILPVTEDARQSALQAGAPLDAFELLTDEVLRPGSGIRGVRVVFNYRIASHPELNTFEQIAYLNDDTSRMYLMLVRCSAPCYRDRGRELHDVANSFTVRSRS
jgi:hypothetical protein